MKKVAPKPRKVSKVVASLAPPVRFVDALPSPCGHEALIARLTQLGAKMRDGRATGGDSDEIFAVVFRLAGPAPIGEQAKLAQHGPERVRPEPARVRQADMKSNRGRYHRGV